MKVLSLLILFSATVTCKEPKTVYICDGGNGKTQRYHYSAKCRGLSNCQYRPQKITLEKAEKDGRTLCKWEKD